MMTRSVRSLLITVAVIQALIGVGFALQIGFITQIWPMPNTGPLSLTLIGSFFVAAAASTLWSLFAGETGSLAGVFLDYVVIFVPLAIYMLLISDGNWGIVSFAIAVAIAAVCGAMGLWQTLLYPIKDPRPQPMLVRISFVIFVVTLIFFGGEMVLQVPNILPWQVSPEGSTIYGLMFLGAAAYFIYALARPSWMNSGGQLAGFLAYDLVLILPFIGHFQKVEDQLLPNLILYVVAVVYSGLLGIYYLFVNRQTRIPLTGDGGMAASESAS